MDNDLSMPQKQHLVLIRQTLYSSGVILTNGKIVSTGAMQRDLTMIITWCNIGGDGLLLVIYSVEVPRGSVA